MQKHPIIFTLLLIFMLGSTAVHAGPRKPLIGHLDGLNLKNSVIVVDDMVFRLAPGYKVKNQSGRTVSAFHLKKGNMVDFKVADDGLVHEIIIKR